jgi:hypothetical protein
MKKKYGFDFHIKFIKTISKTGQSRFFRRFISEFSNKSVILLHSVNKRLYSVIVALFIITVSGIIAQTPDSADLLKSLDYQEKEGYGMEMYTKMTDFKGENKETTFAKVRRKGENAYLEFIKPPNRNGDKILMVRGRFWYSKKGSSNPLPVTPRMQLFGQASVGDILMLNYAKEYEAVSVSSGEYSSKKSYILDLIRKKGENPPYDRILYTVLAKERTGVYAEYFTVSGKLLKRASFESRYIEKHSSYFFNKVIIYDGLNKNNRTEIEYTEPEIRLMPLSEFDKNLLMK